MKTTLAPLALLATLAVATGAQADQTIDVYLHDWLHITPETMQVRQGETLTLNLVNEEGQSSPHNFVLPEFGVQSPLVQPGGRETITFTATQAGTFTYYCGVTGHREGGMVGNLVVQAAEAPSDMAPEKESPGATAAVAALALASIALVLRRRG